MDLLQVRSSMNSLVSSSEDEQFLHTESYAEINKTRPPHPLSYLLAWIRWESMGVPQLELRRLSTWACTVFLTVFMFGNRRLLIIPDDRVQSWWHDLDFLPEGTAWSCREGLNAPHGSWWSEAMLQADPCRSSGKTTQLSWRAPWAKSVRWLSIVPSLMPGISFPYLVYGMGFH